MMTVLWLGFWFALNAGVGAWCWVDFCKDQGAFYFVGALACYIGCLSLVLDIKDALLKL